MARVVGRSRVREGVGSSTRISETAIFILIGIAILFAARWYFVVYRHSPAVALGEYVGAIKSGDIERQYAMIDPYDKQMYPTQQDYEKANKQARGYTERIISSTFAPPVADAKDPTVCTIDATITLRGPSGKELTDTGGTVEVTDKYTLHKDSAGDWKIVLASSPMTNLLKQTPNPPGSSF